MPFKFLDEKSLEKILRKTSLHFENYDANSKTIFDNLPSDYTEKLMKAIVAFEIEIEEMDNVFKLSQNRDAESFENIKQKLCPMNDEAKFIANEMDKRTAELFPE